MKGFLAVALSVILSVAASCYAVTHFGAAGVAPNAKPSVYERVLGSQTLRCGYFEEAPFTIVDPNTGAHSGIAVELAQKIADELGVKLEWQLISNFGAITEDLHNGRYDAICASTFNLPRAGRIDYTLPYAYVPVFAYTQDGRADFDNKLDTLDWTQVTIAGLDGEGATTVMRKKLPQAKFAVLPENAQIADMLMSVADKKADMAFVMPTVFANFDKNNPHRLRRIESAKPAYVFNVGFGLKPDEPAFKNMIDIVMRNLTSNGYLDSLFAKYDPDSLLFRPAALYRSTP